MVWNLILPHTNTWITMKKNQWRICIKGALKCKAEPIPLFVTTPDDKYSTQKDMLFSHIYWGTSQMLNTIFTIITISKLSSSKASYSNFLFLRMDCYFDFEKLLACVKWHLQFLWNSKCLPLIHQNIQVCKIWNLLTLKSLIPGFLKQITNLQQVFLRFFKEIENYSSQRWGSFWPPEVRKNFYLSVQSLK